DKFAGALIPETPVERTRAAPRVGAWKPAGLRPVLTMTASIHTLATSARNKRHVRTCTASVTLAGSTRQLGLRLAGYCLARITRLARGAARALSTSGGVTRRPIGQAVPLRRSVAGPRDQRQQ